MYVVRVDEIAIPERMHMTGASTNIRRTMTPYMMYITRFNQRQSDSVTDVDLENSKGRHDLS